MPYAIISYLLIMLHLRVVVSFHYIVIAKKLFILFSGISYNFSWHTCDNSEIGYFFSDNRIYTYYTTFTD